MNNKNELHQYWKNPPKENSPAAYLAKDTRRSVFLSEIVKANFPETTKILELGCNSGRNLWHLWQSGYRHLHGIEINEQAVVLMKSSVPSMNANVLAGSLEDILPSISETFDLIYTMGVLCHIHPSSEFIFSHIASISKWVLTIEDEKTNKTARHCARNYKDVFGKFGFEEKEYFPSIPGVRPAYVGRLMFKSA